MNVSIRPILVIFLFSWVLLFTPALADDLDCLSGYDRDEQARTLTFSSPATLVAERQSFRLDGLIVERLDEADLEAKKQAMIDHWLQEAKGRAILYRKTRHRKDRYGRIAVFVSLGKVGVAPDITDSLQASLLQAGLARVDLNGLSSICAESLLSYERQARLAKKGLWSLDAYQVRPAEADHLSALVSTYQHVKGTPVSVFRSEKGTSYLNFGHHWKTDFTIALGKKARMQWEGDDKSLEDLRGVSIYVRGWIDTQNGPLIRITHPQQLTRDVGDTKE